MVPISITGRNDVTSRQKEHAKEKVGKLERYFNGITRISVILEKGPERSRAEIVLSVKKGTQIVCHHDDKDLYAAIDLAIDKAEIQLTRHKEKLQERRPTERPDFEALAADEDVDEDVGQEVGVYDDDEG